ALPAASQPMPAASQPMPAASQPMPAAGGDRLGDGRPDDSGRRRRRQPAQRERLGPIRATVRTFGELCITAGLVLILFVVWQLWWTVYQTIRDIESLE